MSRKKINLTKNRVLLSDTLPFEMPITFSNRKFYRFLNNFDVHIDGKNIFWVENKIANIIVSIVNGNDINNIKKIKPIDCVNGRNLKYVYIEKNVKYRIPFSYQISHPTNNYRTISIPHPLSQLLVIDFYDKFKETILYYSKLGNFSVRYPTSVAVCEYHKENGINIKSSVDSIELFKNKYESLKSFFVYKDYSNIYQVYDSPRYLRCEKKYNYLLKLDISRCFESIYTHSFPWAIYTKAFVKNNRDAIADSFSDKFDKLMMKMNHDETNGIIIGPEFSRVFAEIILQRVDKNVECALSEKYKIKTKIHYEIFRYVDDYFVFFDESQHKEVIIQEFSRELCDFKLFLNKNKIEIFDKPIITPHTAAKRKISKLLTSFFELNVHSNEYISFKKYQSKNIILDYKSILKLYNINYHDVLNYSLIICENNICEQIKQTVFNIGCTLDVNTKKILISYLYQRLEFIFFLYSVSPTVNASVRVGRIVSFLKKFLNDNKFSKIELEHIYQLVFDNCTSNIKKLSKSSYRYIEISYLIIIIKSLGRMYRLSEDDIAKYYNIDKIENSFVISSSVSYFSIISILHYISNAKRYINLRKSICNFIKHKFMTNIDEDCLLKSENIFLLFDMISSSLLNEREKNSILKNFVRCPKDRKLLIRYPTLSFSEWNNFNLLNELVAKKSVEVY